MTVDKKITQWYYLLGFYLKRSEFHILPRSYKGEKENDGADFSGYYFFGNVYHDYSGEV